MKVTIKYRYVQVIEMDLESDGDVLPERHVYLLQPGLPTVPKK